MSFRRSAETSRDAGHIRLAALAALGALAAAALADALSGGALRWLAVAATAGALLVAAAAIAVWTARRRRTAAETAAFDDLLGGAQRPAALTDAEGRVLASAAAFAGEGPQPGVVAEALARWSDAPEALAYRLIADARDGGVAAEILAAEAGAMVVSARALAPDRLLWLVEPAVQGPASGPAFAPDAFIESLPVALARLDSDGAIVFANAAARALLGPGAAAGARIGALVEGLGRSMETRVAEALRGDSSGRPEIARAEPDGREVFLQVALTRFEIEGAEGLVAVLADATELKTLEAQFVQSQKMQAVGQLAGGVAHDFNNLLTAIGGHVDLLLQRKEAGDLDYADLTQIKQNSNRAAGLVRQLLAFGRKQTLRPSVVNLADTLTETSHLLNRLLGERVALRIEHAPDLGLVKVDERQFEQVIMNLVVNARDAMPEGGRVMIRTSNARIAAEQRRGRAVMPKGDYVRVDVEDHGHGIPGDKIDQIFEPFFTTKRAGEGTGLGLSTVYGIVKQTGGFIFVDSTPGLGSTFTIYLPRHEGGPEPKPAPPPRPAKAADLTGQGVVLLIEDETPVRAFAARALKMRGYEVLEAASGEDALDILADPELAIDVIVSDVVMPGMDGPSTVREARKLRPDVKVVFVSGYAEDAMKRSMEGVGACHFLAKPFSLNELTAKVKECVSG